MLTVRVQPGAPQSRLKGWRADGVLSLMVRAAPEKGRANRAVLELLADALGIDARRMTVERGQSSRDKAIAIEGVSARELRAPIDRALQAGEQHGG